MAIAITATYYKLGRSQDGVPLASAILTMTGLTAAADNAVSLTSDGTSSGTPLLGASAKLVDVPKYVAAATGGWYESAAPSVDAAGNVVLNIHVDVNGPTAFRIGITYGD
jgi:hypothetical protein